MGSLNLATQLDLCIANVADDVNPDNRAAWTKAIKREDEIAACRVPAKRFVSLHETRLTAGPSNQNRGDEK